MMFLSALADPCPFIHLLFILVRHKQSEPLVNGWSKQLHCFLLYYEISPRLSSPGNDQSFMKFGWRSSLCLLWLCKNSKLGPCLIPLSSLPGNFLTILSPNSAYILSVNSFYSFWKTSHISLHTEAGIINSYI